MGNTSGVLACTESAMSVIDSSRDLLPADEVLGCTDKMDSSILKVSFWAFVIYALSLSPNASGDGFKGIPSI